MGFAHLAVLHILSNLLEVHWVEVVHLDLEDPTKRWTLHNDNRRLIMILNTKLRVKFKVAIGPIWTKITAVL